MSILEAYKKYVNDTALYKQFFFPHALSYGLEDLQRAVMERGIRLQV